MTIKTKLPLLFIFVLAFAFQAFSQTNRFEGFNIFVDAPDTHRETTCAVRFVPPTTEITITDLNPQTPMNIRSCAGSASTVVPRGTNFVMRADPNTYRWCFQGEDKLYRISFQGDQYAGNLTYNWLADSEATGFYNVKDFGARGDGRSDDTVAIRSAFAFIAMRNGGVLNFPEGDYLVGSAGEYKPLALPSGIIIQGVSGIHTGYSTNNPNKRSPSRIRLAGRNRSLFRIGECVEKVVIKDIELFADSNDNTSGIEAVGSYATSQDFYFERVTFSEFNRGINARALTQNDLNWQFDYVKLNHCRFIYNRDAGIYTNLRNSTWRIQSSVFFNPRKQAGQNADSMHFERVGILMIQDTFGGGFPDALGGTYLRILDSGPVTVIGSQTEAMTNSFTYNAEGVAGAGDYSYPITFINSIFGNSIIFRARRTFVSTGNLYLSKTFQSDPLVRVYSTGDRFCYDGAITEGCEGGTSNNFDKSTIIFMTGQPDDWKTKGRPTVFGTQVQFGDSVQMPSFLQNALPTGRANGSMVYCSNCRRNSTPCQTGGTGAPAMVVNGQWSCL